MSFGPIGSAPLAAPGRALVSVTGVLAASVPIVFAASAIWGAQRAVSASGGITFAGTANAAGLHSMAATARIVFSGAPVWSATWDIPVSIPIRFGADALLRAAGRPIIINAVSDRFAFRAEKQNYSFSGQSVSFTFRSVAE